MRVSRQLPQHGALQPALQPDSWQSPDHRHPGSYILFHEWHRSFQRTKPISVNYHFTRKCNKTCTFCFHTEKTAHVADRKETAMGLSLLKGAGMRKTNFAGGEPFLYPELLSWLCKYCKDTLRLESASTITNGTLVKQKWPREHGQYIDVLGVSCDTFDEETDFAIGRGSGNNFQQLFSIRGWCRELGTRFKLNTVVCTLNWEEDMAATVEQLDPFRWKCFQVLVVEDENDASSADAETDRRKRDARSLLIKDEQFKAFCQKHRHLKNFVPEPNDLMASSYLILEGCLCFLDKVNENEKQSSSISEVGVEEALEEVKFDLEAFVKRGGLYAWTKEESTGCHPGERQELEC